MVEPNEDLGRRRWLILSLIFAITVINFIDRQTLSVLAPVLCKALNLSNTEYGRIVSALQFGLMSGEFPVGYLMDRWGARLGTAQRDHPVRQSARFQPAVVTGKQWPSVFEIKIVGPAK